MSQRSASFGYRDVPLEEKPRLVRGVFDRVASRYDLMNDLMSGGVHRLWKDAAVARLNPQPGERILDVAGGTGDLARRIARLARGAQARRGGAPAEVLVVDYNAEMIEAGRARERPEGEPEIDWTVGDAALRPGRRVLRPGGRFLCLEFSTPPAAPMRAAYDAFSFNVIPAIGERVAGDRASYQYLVESIRRFPDQPKFAGMIAGAGFSKVGWTNYTGGVAALHHGWAI